MLYNIICDGGNFGITDSKRYSNGYTWEWVKTKGNNFKQFSYKEAVDISRHILEKARHNGLPEDNKEWGVVVAVSVGPQSFWALPDYIIPRNI